MYIKTEGNPKRTSIKLCKQAIRFYGKYLLGDALYHKIELNLVFEEFSPDTDDLAYCEWEDNNFRAREFTITVNDKLSREAMLMALAHEMVHLKQYAKGELKDYLRANKSKWRGEILELDQIDYWEYPWEIEAHGREKGLYVKFMEHLSKENDDSVRML